VLQEDQAERDVLVVAGLHVPAKLVSRLKELGLKAKIAAIGTRMRHRKVPRHPLIARVTDSGGRGGVAPASGTPKSCVWTGPRRAAGGKSRGCCGRFASNGYLEVLA